MGHLYYWGYMPVPRPAPVTMAALSLTLYYSLLMLIPLQISPLGSASIIKR